MNFPLSSCRYYHHTPSIWNPSTPSTEQDEIVTPQQDATATKKMLFPWQPLPRNSTTAPPPYFWFDLQDNNKAGGLVSRRDGVTQKSLFVRIEKNLRALFFLNVAFFDTFWNNAWTEDLVDSSSWAFAHAVAAILSNMSQNGTYNQQQQQLIFTRFLQDDVRNKASVFFMLTTNLAHFSLTVSLDQIVKTEGDDVLVDFDGNIFPYVPKEMTPAINNMLEKRLIALYYTQSAPPLIKKLQPNVAADPKDEQQQEQQQELQKPCHVKLKMKVLGGRLIGFDVVEFVTRAMAEEDASQKKLLKEAHEAYRTGGIWAYYSTLENVGLNLMQLHGTSSVSFTIIMDVLVDCEEQFTVVDDNGNVVQGDATKTSNAGDAANGEETATPSYRPTCHLVRLENVVEFNVVNNSFERGSWMITDFDDLLQGNQWMDEP
jgi:hypothetical protein